MKQLLITRRDKILNSEKMEQILKYALILTLLTTVFSTGMNAAVIHSNPAAGISAWSLIGRALLIVGPILIAEWYAYKYFHKKAEEARAQHEKEEIERLKTERKARIEEKRAKQQPKKNKKK